MTVSSAAKIGDVAVVTDYVANGSFESLRNNVTYRDAPDYAVLVRLVDHNADWKGNFVYVDKASYEFLRKSSLVPRDIIIANVGANAGTVFRTPDLGLPMTLGPNAILCRSNDENALNNDFFFYWLVSPVGQQSLHSVIAGSAQPKFNKTDFRSLRMTLPSISTQRAIASILCALDDKIDLNRRMNETLEAVAKAIFKDWFVDFGPTRAKMEGRAPYVAPTIWALFPDQVDDEGKPKGWKKEPLLEHARLISGGTPKTAEPAYWDGAVAWASAKDVSQCGDTFLINTERTITEAGLNKSATRIVPKFSTVVVARGATTGRYCMFGRDIAMNQTCYALASLSGRAFWLYSAFGNLVEGLVHAAHGSVFDTITTKTIEGASAIVATDGLLDRFEATVAPLFSQILTNIEGSATLAATRDLLLPKLMSGEICVGDAEEALEAAQ
jgi:type I restriction enzyme S subunit